MARVTHVKKAQQRYAMVVVTNDDGTPKRVPVMRRDGTPKKTKSGREVLLTLKVRDLTKPLPMPKCGSCGNTIEVGQPYKWIEPHGRGTLTRHEGCPTWQVWEYSNSLSARIAQIQNDGPGDDFDSVDDAKQWASDKAQEIRDLAEEKRESASNMEEGFGHETEQSTELNDIADQLNTWADELEETDLPEYPEAESLTCDICSGTGKEDCGACEGSGEDCTECEGEGRVSCEECGETGEVEGDEPSEEQLDEWHEAVRDALQSALDESPV